MRNDGPVVVPVVFQRCSVPRQFDAEPVRALAVRVAIGAFDASLRESFAFPFHESFAFAVDVPNSIAGGHDCPIDFAIEARHANSDDDSTHRVAHVVAHDGRDVVFQHDATREFTLQ
jgi:hypothetical protein